MREKNELINPLVDWALLTGEVGTASIGKTDLSLFVVVITLVDDSSGLSAASRLDCTDSSILLFSTGAQIGSCASFSGKSVGAKFSSVAAVTTSSTVSFDLPSTKGCKSLVAAVASNGMHSEEFSEVTSSTWVSSFTCLFELRTLDLLLALTFANADLDELASDLDVELADAASDLDVELADVARDLDVELIRLDELAADVLSDLDVELADAARDLEVELADAARDLDVELALDLSC